jgi:Uma2 family endonuclease
MTALTARGKLTLADYLAMPETTRPQEAVEGELVILPTPLPVHQLKVLQVARVLEDHVRPAGIGLVFPSPLDVLIREEPLTTRQPDLFVVSTEELGRHPDYETTLPMRARPLLVVELLSPSNSPRQMADRLADYAAIRVGEVWLISLGERTVEVLCLSGGSYLRAGLFRGGELIRSSALPALSLRAEELLR